MADPVDAGQARELELRDEALARHAAAVHRGPGRRNCEDCGDPIPAARRRAVPNATRCIDCENVKELRAKTRRGGAG